MGNLFRGRTRGDKGRHRMYNVLSAEGGADSESGKSVAPQRKGAGRDVRPAESRQGSNKGNKKMGRADDVDAPVKGDGSPHIDMNRFKR